MLLEGYDNACITQYHIIIIIEISQDIYSCCCVEKDTSSSHLQNLKLWSLSKRYSVYEVVLTVICLSQSVCHISQNSQKDVSICYDCVCVYWLSVLGTTKRCWNYWLFFTGWFCYISMCWCLVWMLAWCCTPRLVEQDIELQNFYSNRT